MIKIFNSIIISILLVLTCGCGHHVSDKDNQITSMQLIDRNGFTETISNKDRLASYQEIDFLAPQPYQKVLRVYGKNLSKISSYHGNGHIWQLLEVVDGRAHGIYREWHLNGKLKIDAEIMEGLADITELAQTSWVFDHTSQVWDENGTLIAAIHYDKGLLNTPSLYYHSNGQIAQILPYDQGILHGEALSYNADGILIEKVLYTQGKKQGTCLGYWTAHQLMYQEEYENDFLMKATYYDSQGKLVSSIEKGDGIQSRFLGERLAQKIHFHKGIQEGLIEEFRPNGTLHRITYLLDHKKNGEEIEYYPTALNEKPIPKLSIHWHDDQIQGQVKTWYENGVLESQREMLEYKKQGLSFAWYKNGDIMLMEEYANDLITKASYFKKGDKQAVSQIENGKGMATLYTSDGILVKKIPYDKGKPLLEASEL